MGKAERLYDLLLARRGLSAAILVLATLLAAGGALRVRYDNSYRIWFVEGDPALVAYDDFLDRFGSDEAIIVALDTAGEPLSEETLLIVQGLSEGLARVPGVLDVWSLTHMEALVDAGGALEVRRLIETVPPDADTVARVGGLLKESPLYRRLVSPDRRATAILLSTKQTEGSFEPTARLVREVRDVVAARAGGRDTWVAGGPVMDEAVFRYSEEDAKAYGVVMAVILLAALGWLFRSVAAMLLPPLVVLVALAWSVGFMGWMGFQANVLTTILPPVLAAVGIADAIHLLQHVRLGASRGLPPRDALRTAFVEVLRPCLLTSVTTAAGMASLLAASLQGMRELGAAAAVGVLVAFVMTMAGLPLALSVLPRSWLAGLAAPGRAATSGWLVRAAALAMRRRVLVVCGAAAALAVAVGGASRLRTGSSLLSYVYEDDPMYVDTVAVDRAFGGAFPLEVYVEARGEADLLEPDTLRRIDSIAAELSALPASGEAFSGIDFLREARRVLLGDPPGRLALPATREEAAQILLLLEGRGDVGRYLADDHRSARVEVAVAGTAYEEMVAATPETERRLAELSGERMDATITGLARLMGGMEEYLLESQIRSFSLAFLLVGLLIALLFGSARVGLLAAVPNLLPLALMVGVMGFTGVKLDATNSMIAPLLLGIVVDDTVHVLERVTVARRRGCRVAEAFLVAVEEVGTAVLLTTVVLCAGFLTPILGSFRPNFYFAVLSVLALVLALLADLLVLPALGCLAPRLVPRGKRSRTSQGTKAADSA